MIYAIIYIVGCVVSYLLFRAVVRHDGGGWTVTERFFGLLYSTSSWLMAIAALIALLVLKYCTDKPAKW